MSSTWEWERSTTVKYRLTILCARNVAKQDFFRLPDPFARVIVDGSGQCHTTRSLKGTHIVFIKISISYSPMVPNNMSPRHVWSHDKVGVRGGLARPGTPQAQKIARMD